MKTYILFMPLDLGLKKVGVVKERSSGQTSFLKLWGMEEKVLIPPSSDTWSSGYNSFKYIKLLTCSFKELAVTKIRLLTI